MIAEENFDNSKGIISDENIKKFLMKKGMVNKLKGDGDFRSDECIEYLKEADIVVTNPPFSKFIDLFSLLVKYEKKYWKDRAEIYFIEAKKTQLTLQNLGHY